MEEMYKRMVKGMFQSKRVDKRGNAEGIKVGHKSKNDSTEPAKSNILEKQEEKDNKISLINLNISTFNLPRNMLS